MITKLTDAQVAKFPEYVSKFLKLGLSTQPMTEELKADVIQNMADIYRAGGIEPPKFYIFLDSPMACLLGFVVYEELVKTMNIPQVRSQVESQVGSRVVSQVESQVESQVRSQVRSQVYSQVGSQVGSQVRSQVESQVGSRVWSQVGSRVYSQVRSQVESQVGSRVVSQVNNFCWGGQSAGWLSYYAYFLNETAVSRIDPIRPLVDLCGKCSFYLPYEDVVFVSSNPTHLDMVNGRLHSTTGAAWAYADGFCGYSIDGVAITEDIIRMINGDLPSESALKITNAEQRLLAIKYVGPERLLKHLNGKEISRKGAEYVLHSFTLEGTDCKMLEMQNPSEPKKHYEFVPPEIETVNQALAWRIGWNTFKEPVAKT